MKKFNKKALKILVLIVFISVLVISTSCACPLFSFLENLTGLEVKAGDEIKQESIIDELIYPGSKALIQLTGDIERILEIAGQYGIAFSQEELGVLDNLPEELRKQEVSATIYSTLDNGPDVLDHYNSLSQKGWNMQEYSNDGQGQDSGGPVLLHAAKDERQQALLLAGTGNNTLIIFIDFDWEILAGTGE